MKQKRERDTGHLGIAIHFHFSAFEKAVYLRSVLEADQVVISELKLVFQNLGRDNRVEIRKTTATSTRNEQKDNTLNTH